MLRSVNDLSGFSLIGAEGELGKVEELYFDDERWALRYALMNASEWLRGQQLLISPFSMTQVDWEKRLIHLALTKSEIARSPDIDPHQPISRLIEASYANYYGYPYYWGRAFLWGTVERPAVVTPLSFVASPTTTIAVAAGRTMNSSNPLAASVVAMDVHLRSTQAVSAFSIVATDGEIGQVEDFIFDEESWAIRYLVVDAHQWWAGKKVMIAPQWIASIDWVQTSIYVRLSRAEIKQSPTYDSAAQLSRDYEEQLYGSYGQPGYWLN